MPLARRTLLASLGLLALGRTASASVPVPAGSFPLLPPLPASAPDRRLFAPLEQRFGGYLAILPGMTNDISTVDPVGFMGGNWWRTPNAPYNSRVQEHVYTLSWFYANSRPWNLYYRNAALLARLEAAIAHYLNLQHADGSWPEYSINEKSKAASGFGMGYLAKTLANLRSSGALPLRQAEIQAALRQGMTWFLDPATPIWGPPVEYANQNAAGLAGATLALRLTPDAVLQARLRDRISYIAEHGQSPAGFFYEPAGMDINYNFEVMLPEIAEIYALTRDPTVVTMARRFAEWFGYNVVREPDGSGSLTYVAMSGRTSTSYYDDAIPDPDRTNLGSLFVPEVPALGAFFTSREDRAGLRTAWSRSAGPVPPLAKQDTSPRIIAHVSYGEALPGTEVKQQAIRQLPYLASSDFAVQLKDSLTGQTYCYVRRPSLYVTGFFGTRPTSMVRSSLGMLWHPRAGMVVHSQQDDTSCWASLLPNGNADAHSNLVASYFVGSQAWDGRRVVPGDAPVVIRYALPDGRIRTDVTIASSSVTRAVQGTSALTEQIPLVLLPSDRVSYTSGMQVVYNAYTSGVASGLVIRRAGVTITISWGTSLAASVTPTGVTFLRGGARRLHVLRVPHGGALTTTISFRG